MNERIKELREQASDFAEVAWAKQTQATWKTNKDIHTIYDEKFAELIVRDCVSICQDVDGEDNIDARSGRQDCAVEIKQHFGVEEKTVCHHDWHSAKNPVVLNGSVCVKCGAIDPREPEELKNENN